MSFDMNKFSLQGKVAWITGASYGIGFAIATAFSAAGARIVFNDITPAHVERGLASYREQGIDATGYVCCEKGTVTVPDFWNAMSFSVHTNDGKTWEFAPGRNEMGFVYEIQSVTADILAGRTESSVMPHRSTLRVQRTLEFARHTLGFYYPVETEER